MRTTGLAFVAVAILIAAYWHWRRIRPASPLDELGRVESHRESYPDEGEP